MRRAAGALLALALAACAPDPAVRVRVAFDAAGVTSVRARGLADRATGRRATADDPVRVASISKLVTAIGMMRLVEQGVLSLDAPIATLRNPAFPDRPISLRMLVSHRAGLVDGIDYAPPLGTGLALDDPRAWDATHPPGSYFRYANLNFPVIAEVMERATGERFDRLMARLVLEPLALDACYNWDRCSDAAVARAIVLTDPAGRPVRDDLHGTRPACPVRAEGSCDLTTWRAGGNGSLFAPQGGLRIGMAGLAKIGRLLIGRGSVDGVRLLQPASVDLLLAPVWSYDGAAGQGGNGDPEGGFLCRYGLAVQTLATSVAGCADDPFGDGRPHVGHAGEAYGVRSGLWIDRERGTGVAYVATAVPDDAPHGRSAFTLVEECLARDARRCPRSHAAKAPPQDMR